VLPRSRIKSGHPKADSSRGDLGGEINDPHRLEQVAIYPQATVAVSRRGGRYHPVWVEGALAAGAAHWYQAYLRAGGRLRDSEGFLSLTEDEVVYYADSGMTEVWPYEHIRRYSVRRSMIPLARRLILQGDGWSVHLRVARQLAANAEYILPIKWARLRPNGRAVEAGGRPAPALRAPSGRGRTRHRTMIPGCG
jgi:hypothetical protein